MALTEWELIGTGIGLVTANVSITWVLLRNAVRSIKHHCQMQKEACFDWRKISEKDRECLRGELKNHGHKGLDGNGNKVTV